MNRLLFLLPLLLAGGCSSQEEQADPAQAASAGLQVAPAAMATATAAPAGSDVLVLEQLGDISGVNLGPTLGGCTFQSEGRELLIAGAPDDDNALGRGVVRIDEQLVLLQGGEAGGPAAITAGPELTAEGVTLRVARAEGEGEPLGTESTRWAADLIVTNASGAQRKYSPGTWICGV